MRAQNPEVTHTRNSMFGDRRRCVVFLAGQIAEEIFVDFVRFKAGETKVEIEGLEILEFQPDQLSVEIRPGGRAIHEETKCFDLRLAPFVTEDYRNLLDSGFLRSLEAEVPVDNLAIAERENGNFKTKRVDGRRHFVDRMIILAGIAAVRPQPFQRPMLDFHLRTLDYTSASLTPGCMGTAK